MRKSLQQFMITSFGILVVLTLGTIIFIQQPAFGKDPKGKRLERIKQSPNYKDGAFQNEHPTEMMRKEASYTKMTWELINKPDENKPQMELPSVKINLKTLSDEKPSIVWFGHSSYLIKTKGKNILVDPVFSGYASPISFVGKSFTGSDVYSVNDMPDSIDICIITHNHYDHLDYRTIQKIHPRVKQFYTALGVGADLEDWGVDANKIVELDWWEGNTYKDSIRITAVPARHFSGRGLTRGKTLWAAYVLDVNGYRIFVGGDSGYDSHFKAIGEKFGSFDIAMIECGQYGKDWPLIHMTPEETATAAKEINTKVLLPVHWAKFSLALHPWNEPIDRLLKATAENGVAVTTPLIGEPVILENTLPNKVWWK
jgi:L-ascorbate metabolism protein UlaG (beta-lactamase superfamily)